MKKILIILIVFNCLPIFSQNWLPLQSGNKWQYIDIKIVNRLMSTDTISFHANLINVKIEDSIVINNKTYYKISLYPDDWIYYNTDDSSIYVFWENQDNLYIDFSLPDSSIFQSFLPGGHFYVYPEIISGYSDLFDSTFIYKGIRWFLVTDGSIDVENKFIENIGLSSYEYSEISNQFLNRFINSKRLVQAITGGNYFSESVSPSILFQPVNFISDSSLQLSIRIIHPYSIFINSNYTHTSLNYIDSVNLNVFYSKSGLILFPNTFFAQNVLDSDQWNLSIPINLDLLRNGYSFNYRFEIIDKGLMNGRIFLPDTGYFSAVIDTTNSVNDNSNFIPDRFSLMQNYPNPFNPTTKIKFSIPTLEFVTLKVYDVLGNEVATLVNEEKPAGSYEVEFKSSFGNRQLANGVYFYQLKTGGDYLETKKMILLK